MAQKRKTRRAKRKTTARKSNPFLRPTRRAARRFTRRRNPASAREIGGLNPGTLIENVAFAGAGAILTDTLSAMVPVSGGPVVNLGVKAAVAYGIGVAARKGLGVSKEHAEMLAVGGAVAVAKDAINQYILPIFGNVFAPRLVAVAPNAVPGKAGLKGLGDIVTTRRGAYDPYYGGTPAGLGDIVTRRPYDY
jgi:hypothetical protein